MTVAPTRQHRSGRRWTYRIVTAVVVAECLIGGGMDVLHSPPFYPLLIQLGYPGYLSTMLGVAKILGALVLLAPGLPRLTEWAYAGILINMVGAVASTVAAGQPLGGVVAPAMFAALALVSWAARPGTVDTPV